MLTPAFPTTGQSSNQTVDNEVDDDNDDDVDMVCLHIPPYVSLSYILTTLHWQQDRSDDERNDAGIAAAYAERGADLQVCFISISARVQAVYLGLLVC